MSLGKFQTEIIFPVIWVIWGMAEIYLVFAYGKANF